MAKDTFTVGLAMLPTLTYLKYSVIDSMNVAITNMSTIFLMPSRGGGIPGHTGLIWIMYL